MLYQVMKFHIATSLLAVFWVFASAENETSSDVNLLPKPENLPNVTWTIIDMNLPNREQLCQRQVAYCANTCGGPNYASKNFCNATSMAWGCGCSNKAPDFTPYLWPVVLAECSGKAQACQAECSQSKDRANCSNACDRYYQCGTELTPPSYLQTDSPDQIPSYDGPKQKNTSDTNSNNNNNGTMNSESNAAALIKAPSSSFLLFACSISAMLMRQYAV